MLFPEKNVVKKEKKSKYQWDDSDAINSITGNYYWSDGMTCTFMSCARKAGIKDPKSFGSDFSMFWDYHHNDHSYKEYVHPTKMREMIHWFFECSELKDTLNVSTSGDFLEYYFDIVKAMLKEAC
jgi:hypothetical protein